MTVTLEHLGPSDDLAITWGIWVSLGFIRHLTASLWSPRWWEPGRARSAY